MAIMYTKLFHLLIDLGMKKKDLQEKAKITASIMARLGKNETVRTDTIEKICKALHCQPGDIMEYVEINDLKDAKTNKPVKEKLIIKPQLYEQDYEDVKTLREFYEEENEANILLDSLDKRKDSKD